MEQIETKTTTEESEWSDEGVSIPDDDEKYLENTVSGLGDAMKNVLRQSVPENANPILAKRKTARMREMEEEKSAEKKNKEAKHAKKQKELKNMVIPDPTMMVKERAHRMVATKGVVALFNAIEKYQHAKKASEEDIKSDSKVKQLSKNTFLDLLKNPKENTSRGNVENTVNSSWLQDSYMMDPEVSDKEDTTINKKKSNKRKKSIKSKDVVPDKAHILQELEDEDGNCMHLQK